MAAAASSSSSSSCLSPASSSADSPESQLRRIMPMAALTTEPPSPANGGVFQVRVTVGEEVFIGRGSSAAEARDKCCRKAVRFIDMYWSKREGRFLAPHERKVNNPRANSSLNNSSSSSSVLSEVRPRQPPRAGARFTQHQPPPPPKSGPPFGFRDRQPHPLSGVPQEVRSAIYYPSSNPNAPPGKREALRSPFATASNMEPLGSGGGLSRFVSRSPTKQGLAVRSNQQYQPREDAVNGGVRSQFVRGKHAVNEAGDTRGNSYCYRRDDNGGRSVGAGSGQRYYDEAEHPRRRGGRGGRGLTITSNASASAGGFKTAKDHTRANGTTNRNVPEPRQSPKKGLNSNQGLATDEKVLGNGEGQAEDMRKKFKIPTLIVTSEDNDEEYVEFIEEKLLPNVPIKNAVMMLNELYPPPKAPQYKVTSQTGPPNNPTFTMVCTIDGKSFVGEGKSKKEAKLACSQKAIEVLYGYKMSETKSVPERSNPRANADLDDWMELEGKNPVSILNELYPGIQYQLISTTGPSHAPQFIIKASLNDMSFEGSGKSKKDAKLNASKALLVHLHKVGFDPMTGDMMSTQTNNDDVAEGHTFADNIGKLVTTKYQALFGTTTYSKRRVMSGIVMTKGDRNTMEESEVICVSSGTKCINGEQLSLEGCVINDSHAEIVTRRCLCLYFYRQLELVAASAAEEDKQMSIFERANAMEEPIPLFQLKEGIEFHLFITTSPCGDARIFSLHESPSVNSNLGSGSNSASTQNIVEAVLTDAIDSALVVPPPPAEDSNNNNVNGVDDINSVNDSNNVNGVDGSVVSNGINISIMEKEVEPEDKASESGEDIKANIVDGKPAEEQNEGSKEGVALPDKAESLADALNRARKELSAVGGNGGLGQPPQQQDSSRGMLRSKIECGMGTVPINPKILVQTWDGVMSGDRLLTMACSDKLLRWNVLGVQGALLTHLIKPIYLKSVTVGSKFHPGHMKRALYERIQPHIGELPEDFCVNVPELCATTSPETRQATKAHDYSVNWIVDEGQPEIVNGSTGKTINDNTSRLSKKCLFGRFLDVSSRLLPTPVSSPARYSEVKKLAVDYQRAKTRLTEALAAAGCGHWIEKPVEQDQFSM